MITSNIDGVHIVVPKSFAGIIPVSPYLAQYDYEVETFYGLSQVMKEGTTVLDIGCNFGVFTTLISKRWACKVHAFDGNAEVIPKGRELAAVNYVDPVFNYMLVGETMGTTEFYSIPGFSCPASTRNPQIVIAHANAIKMSVPMTTIDHYCEKNMINPSCIKMDIEGAECSALAGGRNILSKHRPALVIETHGLEINGIMGDLKEVMELLVKYGYKSFQDLQTRQPIDKDEYVARYERKIGHLLAL